MGNSSYTKGNEFYDLKQYEQAIISYDEAIRVKEINKNFDIDL